MHYLNCLTDVTNFNEAKTILEEKNLIVKEYDKSGLYLVKYDKNKCDMSDKDVQKCRGLILSIEDNSVVCPVPHKSVPNIDFVKNFSKNKDNYVIQDFIDGTMINVFRFKEINYISTRSCLGAKCNWLSSTSFNDMFNQCIGNSDLKLESLNMDYCYSFVIQHPDNTIVKKYNEPNLVLTTVSNVTDNGVMFYNTHDFVKQHKYSINVPTLYNFSTIEEIFQYVGSLCSSDQGVVVFDNNEEYLRTKIRNIKYNQVRALRGDTNNKHYLFFSLRQQGNGCYNNYLNFFEEDSELFNFYRTELYAFTQKLFQTYLDCFVNKNKNGTSVKSHKNIDYELKPLVAELHSQFFKTKIPTTKEVVIQYLYNLPIPRLLFAINYKKRINNKSKTAENTAENTVENTVENTAENTDD